MRSLFYLLTLLLFSGLIINYAAKYSVPVFATRVFYHSVLIRNRYLGMKEGNPESNFLGTTTASWKGLSLEAQTFFNIFKFGMSKSQDPESTPTDIRNMVASSNLSPPVSTHSVLKIEEIVTLNNSPFVTLRDRFYMDRYYNLSNQNAKVLMIIHGGGGFSGLGDGMPLRSTVEFMQNKFNHTVLNILSVNYRLIGLNSEEQKDTTRYASNINDQISDCYRAYLWLLREKNYKPEDIVFMGDSFGATLASDLLLKIAHEKVGMPRSAVFISGLFDLTMHTAMKSQTKDNTLVCPGSIITMVRQLYASSISASPMDTWANIDDALKQTKLLLVYGGNEEFTADNRLFISLLKSNNHPSYRVIEAPSMIHNFPFFDYYIPEARSVMDEIMSFVNQ